MGQPPAILESMSVVDPLGNWLFRTMLAVLVWNVAWFALVILNPSDIVGRLFKWGRELWQGRPNPFRTLRYFTNIEAAPDSIRMLYCFRGHHCDGRTDLVGLIGSRVLSHSTNRRSDC